MSVLKFFGGAIAALALIAAVLLLWDSILVWCLLAIGLIAGGWYKVKKMARKKIEERGYLISDIHLNPIQWFFYVRCSLSLLIGLAFAALIWAIFFVLKFYDLLPVQPITWWIFCIITTIGFLYFVQGDEDENGNQIIEEVPPTYHGALVTWLGMVTPIIRTTGDYKWIGKRLGFDRSRKISPTVTNKDKEGDPVEGEKGGFIILGDITFQVWNSSFAKSPQERAKITVPAKNRADVSGSLTYIFRLIKPRLWLDAEDPEMDLGERARQEYQEMTENLNDTDLAAIQPVMHQYMRGTPLITSFISDRVGRHKPGAIMRSRAGTALFTIPEKKSDGTMESESEATQRYIREFLLKRADSKMRAAVTKIDGATGATEIYVTKLQASGPITDVFESRGAEHLRTTFGDITLSETVSKAAAQASAEEDERISLLATAEANKEARKLLKPTPEELANPELYQFAATLAASQDANARNIKVVLVPGANPLTAAAVAAASQIGDKA